MNITYYKLFQNNLKEKRSVQQSTHQNYNFTVKYVTGPRAFTPQSPLTTG